MPKFTPPNHTQIPNVLLDTFLSEISPAELKVTLAVARMTFGWHRETHLMSISYLQKMTGLSRQGVVNGINDGLKRGTLGRREHGQGFEYFLEMEPELVNEVDQDQSTKLTSTSQRSGPELVNEVDTYKERNKLKEEEEKDQPFTLSRQPLTRKGGRLYPAEAGTDDPAAALIVHMQRLIDQPLGLLKKYKEAARVTVLGESDRRTITAWIDHYTAKEAAGMDRGLATRLAYTAIRDANPAPEAPAPVDCTQAQRSVVLAQEWADFLGVPVS